MPQLLAEYDDTFIYMPSFLLWERGELTEGKSFGSASMADLTMISASLPYGQPEKWAKERHTGNTVGFRKLKEVQWRVLPTVKRLIRQYERQNIDSTEFAERMVKMMKCAWRDVYLAGVRSAGVPGGGAGAGKSLVKLGVNEDKWLRSAMTHEMRYLNKFIDAVANDTGRMPYDRRAKMYVDALQSFYESAKVIGMPANTLIRWVGIRDEDTCESCRYIIENNPYTKFTLPATPKSGVTLCLCLTNCYVDISTARGTIPLKDVQVGDFVATHANRWRRVSNVHVNRSVKEHRYAVIVGEGGRLFGVTSDHLVFTERGWITAEVAARTATKVLSGMRRPDYEMVQEWAVPFMFNEASMDWGHQGSDEEIEGAARGRTASENPLRRFDHRLVLHGESRWAEVRSLLGRSCYSVRVPLSLDLGEGEWRDSRGGAYSPSEPRSHGRPTGKLEYGAVVRTPCLSRAGATTESAVAEVFDVRPEVSDAGFGAGTNRAREVLLQTMFGFGQSESGGRRGLQSVRSPHRGASVRRSQDCDSRVRHPYLLSDLLAHLSASDTLQDPAVRLLRDEFRAQAGGHQEIEVETGEVLLLSGVLPEGSPLYDLTVEDDASFVAAGLVVHNSNCRHRLLLRIASHDALQEASSGKTREQHLSALSRIKRTH